MASSYPSLALKGKNVILASTSDRPEFHKAMKPKLEELEAKGVPFIKALKLERNPKNPHWASEESWREKWDEWEDKYKVELRNEHRCSKDEVELLLNTATGVSDDGLQKSMTKGSAIEIKKASEELEKALNPFEGHFNKPDWMADGENTTRFNHFHIYMSIYRTVGFDNHKIPVFYFIPKSLDTSKEISVIVDFGGGGLYTGSSIFESWFKRYKKYQAEQSNSIIMGVHYRRLPWHTGDQIWNDVLYFADHFYPDADLAYLLGLPRSMIRKDNLVLSGESAGGHLAWVVALKAKKMSPKAIFVQYPMLNTYKRVEAYPIDFMGKKFDKETVASLAEKMLEIVRKRKAGKCFKTVSGAHPPKNMAGAMFSSLHEDTWKETFDHDDVPTYLQKNMNINPPTSRPKVFMYHGGNDANCPEKDTRAFIDLLKQESQDWNIVYEVISEKPHGFDVNLDPLDEDHSWLKKMLDAVTEAQIA